MADGHFQTRYTDRQRDAVRSAGLEGHSYATVRRQLAAGELVDAEGKVPPAKMAPSTVANLIRRARDAHGSTWETLPLDQLRDEMRRRAAALVERSQAQLERKAQRGVLDPSKLRSHLAAVRELDALLAPTRRGGDRKARPAEPDTPPVAAPSTTERLAAELTRGSNGTQEPFITG